MKRLLPAIAFALCLTTGLNAQNVKENPASNPVVATPTSNADIKFENMVHDFGNLKWSGNGDCEFKFTNTGKDPLILTNCQGSCGCTVPTCPKEPILPGKSGVIKVHYDTKRPGPINKQVTVQSNAKVGQQILKITGTVEPQPVEEPFPTEKKTNGATPFEKGN
jgi:hypothetical protein